VKSSVSSRSCSAGVRVWRPLDSVVVGGGSQVAMRRWDLARARWVLARMRSAFGAVVGGDMVREEWLLVGEMVV